MALINTDGSQKFSTLVHPPTHYSWCLLTKTKSQDVGPKVVFVVGHKSFCLRVFLVRRGCGGAAEKWKTFGHHLY